MLGNFNHLIDADLELQYETHSRGKKVLNFFLVPTLNIIPRSASNLLKRTHSAAREVIEHATTHKALENLYSRGSAHPHRNFVQRLFHAIWFSTGNSKAVRNRLRLVTREIGLALRDRLKNVEDIEDQKICILSIASGSARAVMAALIQEKVGATAPIKLVFVDKSSHALAYSRQLYADLGLSLPAEWIETTAGSFLRTHIADGSLFDIVEMVGLLDYFDAPKASNLIRDIYNVMRIGGTFITANIVANEEVPFVTKAVGWEMIYRHPHELEHLFAETGFQPEKVKLYCEPLGIHCVAVAKK